MILGQGEARQNPQFQKEKLDSWIKQYNLPQGKTPLRQTVGKYLEHIIHNICH